MLGAEGAKRTMLEIYKEERGKVKRCIYQCKREVNVEFGRKRNQDVNKNRKWFWKEASKVNRGKLESCSKIKDRNKRGRGGKDLEGLF